MARFKPKSVPLLDVWTKSDCVPDAVPRAGVVLSSRTGEGLDALRQRLLAVAGWQSAPDGVFIARARHVQALAAVGTHLDAAVAQLQSASPALDLLAEELRLAQNALNAITGAFGADDLLGVIFSNFCIGK
jgi:tRNA modification GTPase